ncbi:MAG TPA: bifunctional [glutamate--ammonia ligase]-adenylyl-L-tyrosine phosphorylase/[glutamate--ammonia-ligase] adenylyltransferase, partial [Anaeromyxobacteraceae bacterium]
HLADFAAALRTPEPYFRLLGEQRRVARLLLLLFGTSDFLSKRFLRHPELLDALLREDTVALTKGKEAFRREIGERLGAVDGSGGLDDRLERQLGELRRYKDEEVLRIAIHDIAGTIDLAGVTAQLTELAECCLESSLSLAEDEAREKAKRPPGRLCVVGMGKLGGRELGYHSDLDLIFLYPGEEEPGGPGAGQSGTHQLHSRLAQRFMAFLQMPLREGFLYKIDTRLRPSGNQGALVISVQGFTRYHAAAGAEQVRSQLWERQALLRARHVAGDAQLWKQVHERVILPAVYGPVADRAAMAAEVRRMRERMEAQIGKESTRGKNPKTGRGGLVDVEFAVQFLQLAHGHLNPSVRTPSTLAALQRLREAGLLREAHHQALHEGYQFLRRLELRLRIVHDYAIDHLPEEERQLRQLARRLGYFGEDPGARLLADYARVTEEVRRAYEEVVA